jgi:hypothetical protein
MSVVLFVTEKLLVGKQLSNNFDFKTALTIAALK